MARLIQPTTKRILKARPYVLRSYFGWTLLNAKIPSNWQSFFMGHKREIFRTVEDHLTKIPRQASMEDQRKTDKSVKPIGVF